MSKEQTDLLPCPFCATAPKLETTAAGTYIHCPNDQCIAYNTGALPFNDWSHEDAAIAAWNRRTSPSPAGGVQAGRIAALEALLRDARQEFKVGSGYLDGSVDKLTLEAATAGLNKRFVTMIADIDAALSSQAQTTGGVE